MYFLYLFEKGKSVLCRQLRNISTISQLGYLTDPGMTRRRKHTHPLIQTPSEETDPFVTFNLTFTDLLAPKRSVVAQTPMIVLTNRPIFAAF